MSVDDDLQKFNDELQEFIDEIPKESLRVQKKMVLEALRRIVLRTPVRTGRARGNWQVTIGSPAGSLVEDYQKIESNEKMAAAPGLDVVGDEVIANGLAAIATLPPFDVVWISNNLDYIEFLEDGTSDQAPEGMVSLTVQELEQMFK